MSPVACSVARLEPAAVAAVLAWARGDGSPPGEIQGDELRWLLAWSDGGVTWGRRAGVGWRLSSAPFPEASPPIEEPALQELRLFGPEAEIRLWRADGGFQGRRIADAPGEDLQPPVTPRNESWLLVGDRLAAVRDGFALVNGRAGRRQALPLPLETDENQAERTLPWRLEIRHHFEQSPETGAVRVALTRLLDVVTGDASAAEEEGSP